MTNARGLSIMIGKMKLPEDVRAYFQRQGKIGAAKRKAILTPERRSEIARTAALARWSGQVKETTVKLSKRKKGTK